MNIRKWMNMVLLSVILAAAVMSWDHTTAFAKEEQGATQQAEQGSIPEDAIRLRILANSDSEEDQDLKRKVRDQVVQQINTWLREQAQPASREEARAFIESHLEELQETAEAVVQQHGKGYNVKAELKVVPFPAKLYGGEVYPAGDYEALRITLGEGSGQNWWCVLFPPLCFVDGSEGTATAAETSDDKKEQDKGSNESASKQSAGTGEQAASEHEGGQEKEVRFFLVDMMITLINWIMDLVKSLFG
ncbi:stage II sporulation protein R [Paenibacillus sp. 1001270B_150601_E10]|uniref:stage II sporulation protein R n=1 Tax=Paenibacillus sp. 1001270B_150601_E10 TaxID=2787079 RepID=UPI00189C91FB|nr:stage II sporulation protein R [Paenibacillus sp. 1001270B_150601_E10]